MRLSSKIVSALLGSTLSMALPGCAPRLAEAPPPRTLAVAVQDTPPAELTRCPARPEGFPVDAVAQLPVAVRDAAIRLAQAFAANTTQLERLIEWTAAGSCGAEHGAPDAEAR